MHKVMEILKSLNSDSNAKPNPDSMHNGKLLNDQPLLPNPLI